MSNPKPVEQMTVDELEEEAVDLYREEGLDCLDHVFNRGDNFRAAVSELARRARAYEALAAKVQSGPRSESEMFSRGRGFLCSTEF